METHMLNKFPSSHCWSAVPAVGVFPDIPIIHFLDLEILLYLFLYVSGQDGTSPITVDITEQSQFAHTKKKINYENLFPLSRDVYPCAFLTSTSCHTAMRDDNIWWHYALFSIWLTFLSFFFLQHFKSFLKICIKTGLKHESVI